MQKKNFIYLPAIFLFVAHQRLQSNEKQQQSKTLLMM